MKKIFTLLLCAFFCTMVMAQAPNVIIKKASVAPVIDGVVDDVWAVASKQNIDKPFQTETPTLGQSGETTWQALWTDYGLFILLRVNDDDFYPAYMNNNYAAWNFDHPELYFDVNLVKKDGLGSQAIGNKGHYLIVPGFLESEFDGTIHDNGVRGQYAFKVNNPTYVAEYFIPFSYLLDKDGDDLDITQPIGFDVTIVDGDSSAPGVRQRAVWSNVGAINESYFNMDDCGTITLSSFDSGHIAKAETAPEIDGVIDAVWANATAYPIDKPFQTETPTLGESGQTTWQGLWSIDGMYILLKVTDDEFYPAFKNNASDNLMYDKPEIYFDVNAVKKDGLGGKNAGDGHIQIAPGFVEASIDGTPVQDGDGIHAFKVTDPNYVAEYFVPWSKLTDKDKNEVNKATPMGFDVTIIDGESAASGVRQRAVWSNPGTGPAASESWGNMDDCGLVMFDNPCACEVESITVSGGTEINIDNGTLQMVAVVAPADAVQNVKWVVENGTGRATITTKGVLTGIVDGTVVVKAIAKDGTNVEGKTTVTISGQITTLEEINIIKNSKFELGPDGKQSWVGSGTVEDSWYNLVCTPKTNIWDTMFGQRNLPITDAETPYTVKFKAVATADMIVPMLFEDRNNDNNKAVYSIVEYRDNVYGKWDVPVTTEARWYTIDVIFSAWVPNSAYELNFQLGLADGTFSIDSIYMYNDIRLCCFGVKTLSNFNKVQLYPNPVQNELTITKIAEANSKVSVYNAVGQKLMEKTANRNQAKFDVANLRKGMYFVRFSDGSSEKFIKQ
jgi:hypothetical protein